MFNTFRSRIDSPAHVEYFGKGTRPPFSLLLLILINFSKLRHFVTRHLRQDQLEITSCEALPTMYNMDEESIFTYAKYFEPLTIMRANIDELRDEIVCQIFQTWNFLFLFRQPTSTVRTCRATLFLFKDKIVFTKFSALFDLVGFGNKSNLPFLPLLLMDHIKPSALRMYRHLVGPIIAIGKTFRAFGFLELCDSHPFGLVTFFVFLLQLLT